MLSSAHRKGEPRADDKEVLEIGWFIKQEVVGLDTLPGIKESVALVVWCYASFLSRKICGVCTLHADTVRQAMSIAGAGNAGKLLLLQFFIKGVGRFYLAMVLILRLVK